MTSGALSNRLATETLGLKALTGDRLSTSMSQVVTMVLALVIAFLANWRVSSIPNFPHNTCSRVIDDVNYVGLVSTHWNGAQIEIPSLLMRAFLSSRHT